ncbi:unnamed protein product [Auanema sp. JU1783]|nr:unnamed protein product [Auanema sp. JU1783]
MITKNLLDVQNGTMPEQGLSYITKPEGEMDMLIGFFLMNGVCIVFFLLFGMCVIFSCMRRRPKLFRASPPENAPLAPTVKPKTSPGFKSLVNKAMKSPNLARLRAANEVPSSKRETTVSAEGNQIEVHVTDDKSPDRSSMGQNAKRKPVTQAIVVDETHFPREERKSVIRENLLGPLSFDDLYYT